MLLSWPLYLNVYKETSRRKPLLVQMSKRTVSGLLKEAVRDWRGLSRGASIPLYTAYLVSLKS